MFDSPIQFEEADKAIAERLPADTALKYQDILRQWTPEARQRAFFSARVMDATVLSELKRRVQQVVSGDMTSEQATRLMQEFFRGEGAPLLQRMGFLPQDQGQGKGVSELASTARLRLIFETNTRMAQEVGHYKQWEAVKEAYPYGIWHCGYAEEHRPEHLARDGKAYPFDHSIWTQSPPGGEFNCHCWREPISAEEAAMRGLIPEPMDSAFQPSSLGFDPSRGMDQPVQPGRRTDPELAEKAKVPPSPEQLAPILPAPAAEPAPLPQSQPTAPPVPKVAIEGRGTPDVGRLEDGGKHGRLVTGEEIDRKTQELREAIAQAASPEQATSSETAAHTVAVTKTLSPAPESGTHQSDSVEPAMPTAEEIDGLERLPVEQLMEKEQQLLGSLGTPASEAEVRKTIGLVQWIKETIREHQAIANIRKLTLLRKDQARITLIDTPKELLGDAKKAIGLVQGIISKSLLPPGNAHVGIIKSNDGRGHFRDNNIEVPGGVKVLQIAHEIGHWLEEINPEIRQKCIDFRDRRCAGYPVISLKKLFPDGDFTPFEQTQVDKFTRVYAGKVYINKSGKTYRTEILSMGIQQVLENPSKFKKEDPEYYNFIVELLKLKDLAK